MEHYQSFQYHAVLLICLIIPHNQEYYREWERLQRFLQANSPIEHVTILVEIELAIGGEQLVIIAVLDQQEDNELSHVHAA